MSGFLFIHSFRSGLCFYYCAMNCDVECEGIRLQMQGFESPTGYVKPLSTMNGFLPIALHPDTNANSALQPEALDAT